MAKAWTVGDGLCATFLVFLTIRSALALDGYYFYDVDNTEIHTHEFLPLSSDEHSVQKRQVNNAAVAGPTKTKPYLTTPAPISVPVEGFVRPHLTQPLNTTILTDVATPKPMTQALTLPPLPNPPHLSEDAIITTNQTDDDTDDITISKFSDSTLNFNDTLKKHNISITQMDTHIYYNSSFKTDAAAGKYYWVDMENRTDVKVSELLSKSHRRAATVRLSFDFPFYGHIIRNVTIATGGFLYTGDYVHSWLAATQYIAPLMANFDTSLSNHSYIKYVDNGTAFTVLWENVSLQDKPDGGKFTFQTTLHDTGDIAFVYQTVPIIIEQIQDSHHPVKVGLSDAYIIDRTIFFVRRKTIYEYHRVNFRKEDIKNSTVIYLSALPTCPGIKDCNSCLTNVLKNFKCTWCPSLEKCSNGLDRSRQDWLIKNCDKRQIKNESECLRTYTHGPFDDHDLTYSHDNNYEPIGEDPMRASSRISQDSNGILNPVDGVKMGVSSIVAILFIAALGFGLGFWTLYAYRNPHTTSGQMLIRYRPSQWSWRRGEARYTAATIHM